MKNKKAKEKPLYSIWQNVKFTTVNIWKWDKPLVFLCVAKAPINVALQLYGIYIVKLVMSLIEKGSEPLIFIINIFLFSAGLLTLNILNNIISAKIQWRQYRIRFKYLNILIDKNLDTDYENVESPEGLDKLQKAFDAVVSDDSATQNIINILVYVATSVISIITLSAIISALNPLLLLFITAVLLGQYFVNRACQHWHFKNTKNWVRHDRKLYYIDSVSGSFDRAKDIRLYSLKPWLRDIFGSVLGQREKWYKKAERTSYAYYDIGQAVQMTLTNGATFIYIVSSVMNKTITVADAVFYISAVGTFAGVIMDVFNSISQLHGASLSICYLREFLDIKDRSNRGVGIKPPEETFDIEFKNISFAYPKTENSTLDNISFKIKKGEKVAIVGRNGAGKTTLVKLLCGLYKPTEGDIKINGANISEYNRDEYFSLVSAVFQDIYLYPASITQNIALCKDGNIDSERLLRAIRLAGLKDKVDSLPGGYNTLLMKGVVENAIELSGGEKQKLALARSLYKDGLFLILDEPTAALDPIAENEMYLKYGAFTEGKTSVFISHRLSSTRFCDRIFFLEDGKITETGSHDELMALGGKYAEMFDIQSYYYKEGAADEKA